MSFSIKYISANVYDAFSVRRVNDRAMFARVMNEIVGIKEKVQIFCSLGKEERFHPIFFAVVANIFNLKNLKHTLNVIFIYIELTA